MFSSVPYEMGWRRPSAPLVKEHIRAAHQTDTARSCLTALADHASVVLAALAVVVTARGSSSVDLALAIAVAAVVTGRAQRGLEVLVHEASHGNICRADRRLNDRCGDLLAGWAVGLGVGDYRDGHSLHHRFYATDRDPDRARYVDLDIESLDRGSRAAYLRGVLARLPGYSVSWWVAVGTSPSCLWRILVTTSVLQVLPAYLIAGPTAAAICAALAAAGLLLVTPVIRFLGETSEHQYLRAVTVLGTTVTNVGLVQRLLVHPHGDGWHQLHHILPGVPHHRLRRLHHHLLAHDVDGYAATLRYRTRVRQEPSGLALLERVG